MRIHDGYLLYPFLNELKNGFIEWASALKIKDHVANKIPIKFQQALSDVYGSHWLNAWKTKADVQEIIIQPADGSPEYFVLDYNEMYANSSNISDSRFYANFGCTPMIPEGTRIEIIISALSECDQFRSLVRSYNFKIQSEKSMDGLMKELLLLF